VINNAQNLLSKVGYHNEIKLPAAITICFLQCSQDKDGNLNDVIGIILTCVENKVKQYLLIKTVLAKNSILLFN
jgi:hypothetical protein